MSDTFEERARQLSDEQLLDMVENKREDFTPEAIAAADAELAVRGGKEHLVEKIGREADERIRQRHLDEQKRWAELAEQARAGDLTGDRTLKEETIMEVWTAMVRDGAGNGQKVTETIKRNLSDARMPCPTNWGVVAVKTQGWVSRVWRSFLVITHEDFPDYHQYVSIRDFGTYLDCMRVLTVEPGFVKKYLSKRLAGDPTALSAPKNILKHHDLNSWNAVVNDCVQRAITSLVIELGQTPEQVRTGEKTFLDIW